MIRLAPFAAVAVVLLAAGLVQAQVYTTYYVPTTTYYQPATVYYAPTPTTTVAYSQPQVDCCCAQAQPATTTTTYYAPTTTTYVATTPTVVYYPAVPRYRTYFRWW